MYFQKVQPKKLIKITLKVAIPNDNFISYYYCNKKCGFVKFQVAALYLKYGTSLFKLSIFYIAPFKRQYDIKCGVGIIEIGSGHLGLLLFNSSLQSCLQLGQVGLVHSFSNHVEIHFGWNMWSQGVILRFSFFLKSSWQIAQEESAEFPLNSTSLIIAAYFSLSKFILTGDNVGKLAPVTVIVITPPCSLVIVILPPWANIAEGTKFKMFCPSGITKRLNCGSRRIV